MPKIDYRLRKRLPSPVGTCSERLSPLSFLIELNSQFGLGAFANQVGKHLLQNINTMLRAVFDHVGRSADMGKSVSLSENHIFSLAACSGDNPINSSFVSHADGKSQRMTVHSSFTALSQSSRLMGNKDASLAVDDTGKISPVRVTHRRHRKNVVCVLR